MGGGGQVTDHPDFGCGGDAAVLLEHPAMVGEQQLEAEAQGQDERQPQECAEHQRRKHGLALRA